MVKLDVWVAEIERSLAELGPLPGLGDVKSASSAMAGTVATTGFPGVLPLWTGRRRIFGLQVDPQTHPRTWAGVIIKDRQGLTIASDSRTLLPRAIVQEALSPATDTAQRLADRWGEVGKDLLDLHRILGGLDDTLDEVMTVIVDPVARAVFEGGQGERVAFEAAHSALCRKIDQSESFVRYADWLDACIAGQWAAPEEPAQYGVWNRRVLCWASRLAVSVPEMPRLPAAWLYEILEGNAGIDAGIPRTASWHVRAGSASGETAIVEAARSIAEWETSEDSISVGVRHALLTEGTSYRGLAHAEAAAALDERGEPERAWQALQAAAWWAARNVGEVPEAILKGTRFLADRHEWTDAAWVLERGFSG